MDTWNKNTGEKKRVYGHVVCVCVCENMYVNKCIRILTFCLPQALLLKMYLKLFSTTKGKGAKTPSRFNTISFIMNESGNFECFGADEFDVIYYFNKHGKHIHLLLLKIFSDTTFQYCWLCSLLGLNWTDGMESRFIFYRIYY